MAGKKAQAAQLQAELNTDDEWDDFVKKRGLLLVDIYSDWCGPCSGMCANLKKIKLDIGGDMLQYAIAKSDNITVLERFRNKSEPTWMFIANQKMVNLIFGADFPRLLLVITNELKKETAAIEGTRQRDEMEFTDLADEERVRWEKVQAIEEENRRIEEEERVKALYKKRLDICNNLLETQSNVGVLVVFPHAKEQFLEILEDNFAEYGLETGKSEKIKHLDEEHLEKMLFFTSWRFSDASIRQLCHSKDCIAILIRPTSDDTSETVDDLLLKAVYGESKEPPGMPGSPAQQLILVVSGEEEEEEEEEVIEEEEEGHEEGMEESEIEHGPVEFIGIWAPENALTKAYCIKVLFPKISDPLAIPEPEPTPPHIAVAFDAFKSTEVLKCVEEYPSEVIRYGFFTDDQIGTCELIAKTLPAFEKKLVQGHTANEKIILQLARRRSECVLAFAQLGPTYISVNTREGKADCKILFPKDYDKPDEVEEPPEAKKSSSKKKVRSKTQVKSGEDLAAVSETVVDVEGAAPAENVGEEGVAPAGDEGVVAPEGDEGVAPEGEDKATSPMEETPPA